MQARSDSARAGCRSGVDRPVRAARHRRLPVELLAGVGRPAGDQDAARASCSRQYLQLPTAFYDRESSANLLSRLTYNIELLAEASDQFGHGADPRLADDHRADRLPVLSQLAAGGHRIMLAPVIAWLIRRVNQLLPPLQRAHPELDGRRHARRQGGHRGRIALIKLFNAQEHEAQRLRPSERAQPPQQHEADPRRARCQQSRRAAHRVDRPRLRAVRR